LSTLELKPAAMQLKGARETALEQLFAEPFEPAAVDGYVQGWKPPDLDALEVHEDLRWVRARRLSAPVAIAASVLSTAGRVIAWSLTSGGAGFNGEMRGERNTGIVAGNAVGIGGAAVFGLSAVVWAVASWLLLRP